jgi:hypothetical protein
LLAFPASPMLPVLRLWFFSGLPPSHSDPYHDWITGEEREGYRWPKIVWTTWGSGVLKCNTDGSCSSQRDLLSMLLGRLGSVDVKILTFWCKMLYAALVALPADHFP